MNRTQKGAASAIGVFILIVIIATMVGVSLNLARSALSDANMQNNSIQVNYLAESALERAVFNLNADPDCNNLVNPNQQTFGNGTFEISSITVIGATTECDVKIKAEVNGIVRYINAKIFNNGGAGGGGGGANFAEQFNYVNTGAMTVNWAETLTQTQGDSRWDSTNCNATCTGALGGSFYAETTGAGFFAIKRYTGYRERSIPTINTTATGLTLNVSGGFKKGSSGTNPIQQDISIELYVSGNEAATVVELWSDTSVSRTNTWLPISAAVPLSANLLYDTLRIRYNLAGQEYSIKGTLINLHPWVWVDEIFLGASSGGGIAPDWQVVNWQEVSN